MELITKERNGLTVIEMRNTFLDLSPFPWPNIQKQRADIIPSIDESMDFLYLYNLRKGVMGWKRPITKSFLSISI